jgi:hypothetical protein
MLGGLRLLAIENLGWFTGQRRLAIVAVIITLIVAFAFLASVFQ